MTPKPNQVDNLLEKLVRDVQPVSYMNNLPPPHVLPKLHDDAKTALKEAVLAALPEKYEPILSVKEFSVNSEQQIIETTRHHEGYNQALADVTKAIEELFK